MLIIHSPAPKIVCSIQHTVCSTKLANVLVKLANSTFIQIIIEKMD